MSEADQTSVGALDSVQGERSRRARHLAAKGQLATLRGRGHCCAMLPREAFARAGDLTSEGCC